MLELNLQDCALAGKLDLNLRELLAKLHIGHAEAKHRAVIGLLDVLLEGEKSILPALVQLLTAMAPKVREKAATVLCLLDGAQGSAGRISGRS
jgi:hypothetical protein